MNDLISRQALMKEFSDFVRASNNSDFARTPTWNDAVSLVGSMPDAQPEIIQCKDCENWIPGYITDNDDFIPPKCGKYQQMVGHSSNDYCSLAERRTDE